MKLTAVIVEDSRLARNELKELMKAHDDIELIGEAENVDEGFKLINKTNPDLLFLDINMPEKDGFELLEMLDDVPTVIFTTAFDEYAIKAFQLNSIDYLLKPIVPEALDNALKKYSELKNHYASSQSNISETQLAKILELSNIAHEYKSRFLVKIGDQIKYVTIDNIAYFFAEDNVVFMVTKASQKYIIDYSLNQLDDYLNPKVFFRLNRAFFASIHSINKIHKFFNSRLKIELSPKTEQDILISRVKVNEFLEWMES